MSDRMLSDGARLRLEQLIAEDNRSIGDQICVLITEWEGSEDQREAIDNAICKIMVDHGPDRHVDGHDILTDYVLRLLASERERCAKIAEEHDCDSYDCGCAFDIAAKIRSGE